MMKERWIVSGRGSEEEYASAAIESGRPIE
jgi:hypothetical protein